MNRFILSLVATLSAFTLPVSARPEQPSAITSCTCIDLSHTSGKGNHESPVTKTPLVNGTRISSAFGMRVHPIFGYWAMHWGLDIAAHYGAPIYATADGVVEEAGPKGGYGNYILLRHSRTYKTAYAHASVFAPGIRPGARVSQGQIIAQVGSTGESTGPHLHYESWVRGWPINPVCACTRPIPLTRHRSAKKRKCNERRSLKKRMSLEVCPKNRATQKEGL